MMRAVRAGGGRFRRTGIGTKLVTICLIAVFFAGIVLIADGLLLKAEGDGGHVLRLPGLVSGHAEGHRGAPVQPR